MKGITVNVFLSSFCVGTFTFLMALAGSSSAKEEMCESPRNDAKGILQVCYRAGDPITPSLKRQYWRFINNSDERVTFTYFVYGTHNGSDLRLASRTLTLLPHFSQTSSDASSDQFVGSNGPIRAEVYFSSVSAAGSSASSKKNWCISDAYVMPGTCKCMPHTTLDSDSKTGQVICRRKAPSKEKAAPTIMAVANEPSACDPAITSCLSGGTKPPSAATAAPNKKAAQPSSSRKGYGAQVVGLFR